MEKTEQQKTLWLYHYLFVAIIQSAGVKNILWKSYQTSHGIGLQKISSKIAFKGSKPIARTRQKA